MKKLWVNVIPYSKEIAMGVFFVAASLISFLFFVARDEYEPAAKEAKPKEKAPTAKPAPEVKRDEHEEEYTPAVEKPKAPLTNLPIETIEGIGKVYGAQLRGAGIKTVADLIASTPTKVAQACEVHTEQAERWIAMGRFAWLDEISEEDAEAIVFATGITDLKALARANPNDALSKVQAALKAGDVRVPAGYSISLDKVNSWIDAAKRV